MVGLPTLGIMQKKVKRGFMREKIERIIQLRKAHRILFPMIAVVLCIVLTSGVMAAVTALNQPVGITVTITAPAGGGGGAVPPPDTQAYVYAAASNDSILTSLDFEYAYGGSDTKVAYVKSSEVTVDPSIESVSAVFTEASINFTAVLGNTSDGWTELLITASGGAVDTYGESDYSDKVTFTGGVATP